MVVGVDVGGTKISASVVDEEGRILGCIKVPASRYVPDIAKAATGAVRAAGLTWSDVSRAGVAIPGIYFPETGRAWAPNLWGRSEIELRDPLAALLPAELFIDNDRSAYAAGEQWVGAARGLSDVVFLAVGTGIGAGILSGGRILRGASGIAGSVGWMALDARWQEIYRKVGCFEARAAGPGVARAAGMASAEAVVAAARSGNEKARRVLEEAASWLAMGIANLISVLNPEMVVLGGGLMQAGDLMIGQIRGEVLDWAQPVAAKMTRIELTQLGENAGLLGAARLAWLGAQGIEA